MTDLSGPYSAFSNAWVAGLRSSIHAINASGGVDGREIELLERDNASDLQRATTNFRELVGTDALAIHGNNLSNIIAAVAPQADSAEVSMVNFTDVPQVMSPNPPEYVFSAEVPVTTWAELQLEFAADLFEEKGITNPRIAIYTIETAAADPYREALREDAEQRGWEVVASESAEQTATDVTPQARAIARAEPDAVLTYVINIVQGVTAMKAQGLDASVAIISQKQSGDNANFEAIDQLGQEFYALRSFASPYETDIPAIAEMREHMEEAGQWRDQFIGNEWVTAGYVEGLMIREALSMCGDDCDRADYRDALANMTSLDTLDLSGTYGNEGDHRFVKEGRAYQWDSASGLPQPLGDTWVAAQP